MARTIAPRGTKFICAKASLEKLAPSQSFSISLSGFEIDMAGSSVLSLLGSKQGQKSKGYVLRRATSREGVFWDLKGLRS